MWYYQAKAGTWSLSVLFQNVVLFTEIHLQYLSSMHNVAFFPSLPLTERQKNKIILKIQPCFLYIKLQCCSWMAQQGVHSSWMVKLSLPLLIPIATQVSWGPEQQICFHSGTRHLFPLTHFPGVVPYTHWLQSGICRFLLLKAWFRWGCLDHFKSCLSSESQLPVWGWSSLPHHNNDSFLSFCWGFAAVCLQTQSSKSPFHHGSSCLPALPAQIMLPAAFALWQTLRQVKPQETELPRLRKHCLSSLPN